MADKDRKDRPYFFSVDRDKIKIKLKKMSSRYLSPGRGNKIVAVIIVFCFLLGIGIAVYRGHNLNTEEKAEEIPPEITSNFELRRDELTLPDTDENYESENEETDEEAGTGQNRKKNGVEEKEEEESPVTRPVQPVTGGEETDEILRPVGGEIIRRPGWHYHPVFSDWRYQEGVLLQGDEGDIVMAAQDGEVDSVKEDPYRGVMVTVDHGEGQKTVYGHLQRTAVSSGETIGKGQEVGRIGTTGISSETSLYFELRDEEEVLDAARYFEQ
ncbi:MAG: peptidoglycan DD-metalloendopeptidase family protein [Halanaerobiaceae bacterium]